MMRFKTVSLFDYGNGPRAVFLTSIRGNDKTLYARSKTYRPTEASIKRLARVAYRHSTMRLEPNLVSVGWTLSRKEKVLNAT